MLNFWSSKQKWSQGKYRGIAEAQWLNIECPECTHINLNSSDTLTNVTFQWDWLPECYCITLKSRPERLDSAIKEFHKVGLCKKVIFYQTERDKISGMRGCWESHRAIAKKCLQEKVPWYLCFEDDITFDQKIFSQETINQLKDSLDHLPKEWCFLFLGGVPRWIYPTTISHHFVGYSGWLTHAGFYSKELAEKLYESPFDMINQDITDKKDTIELDNWFAKNFDSKTFLFFPPVAFVNPKLESDLIHERQPILKQLQETYSQELNQMYLWFSLIYPIILLVSIVVIVIMVIWIMVEREAYLKNIGINMGHQHTNQQILDRQLSTGSIPQDYGLA